MSANLAGLATLITATLIEANIQVHTVYLISKNIAKLLFMMKVLVKLNKIFYHQAWLVFLAKDYELPKTFLLSSFSINN